MNQKIMNQKIIPVLDRAHGTFNADGTPFQGKASPAYNVPNKYKDDDDLIFREAESSESLIDEIEKELNTRGFIFVERIVPNDEMREFGLLWRKIQINTYYAKWNAKGKKILMLSVHHNAQYLGDKWGTAEGVCVYTSPGQTSSDMPAHRLAESFKKNFPDWNVRVDKSDKDNDYEAPFTVLMANGMGILIELGFQDTRTEVKKLKDETFRKRIVDTIVDWFVEENNNA